MRSDKKKALALRLKGSSYGQIQHQLGIPKSTLSGWFLHLLLPQKAILKIERRRAEASYRGLIKRNKNQTHLARQRASMARGLGARDIGELSSRELLLVGTALYWGEGYKRLVVRDGRELTSHKIGFSNADPKMVKIFMRFLKETLKISQGRIKASIRIFEHINEKDALDYWQKITELPIGNFTKSYYGISKSSLHKKPFNRLPFGTIQITVGDTMNFYRVMGWIDGLGK